MRLQCAVVWEVFVKPDLPLLARPLAAAVNACKSSRVALMQRVDKRIASLTVVHGDARTPVTLSEDRYSFRVPVYKKGLPDAARVRFRYD